MRMIVTIITHPLATKLIHYMAQNAILHVSKCLLISHVLARGSGSGFRSTRPQLLVPFSEHKGCEC